jgi:DNA-binding response OmpR family regulator
MMIAVPTAPSLLVLLVEDDRKLAGLTREYLAGHGVEVTHVADGKAGLEQALQGRWDAVLLDLMLPGLDGLSVCRELLARLRAVTRRAKGKAGPPTATVKVGGLELDPASRRAVLDGRELPLTGYEFDLLRALAERAGRILSREQLMELAKGSAEEAFDRSIDVHVSRLRQKLGDDPKRPRLIKTVRGAGYLLAGEGE